MKKCLRLLLAFVFVFNVAFGTTNLVFADKPAGGENTNYIHVHIQGDKSAVTSVEVTYNGYAPYELEQISAGLWSHEDNKTFVKENIESIKVNGVEVSNYTTSAEGAGSINIWVDWDSNPDFTITKTVDPESAYRGDTVKFTITVANNGNMDLSGIRVVDTMLGIDQAVNVKIGKSVEISEFYKIPSDQAYGTLKNTATATLDKTSKDASAEVEILERQQPGLSITKSADVESASAGDEIEYTIIVANEGNVALDGVEVVDEMVGLEETVNLAVGGSRTFKVKYAVPADASGDIENTASASWQNLYEEASAVVELLPPKGPAQIAGLQVNKTVDKEKAQTGDRLRYTIEVKNTGNVDLTDVALDDELVGMHETITLLKAGEAKTFYATYDIPEWMDDRIIKNTAVSSAEYNHEQITASGSAETDVAKKVVIIEDEDPPKGGHEEPGNPPVNNPPVNDPPARHTVVVTIEEDEVPLGSLPQTGGIPITDFFVIGSGLAVLGFFVRRKQ